MIAEREARNKRIVELWMACHTQDEIAETVGVPQQTVADVLPKTADVPDPVKPAALHYADFDPPIYNVCTPA